MIYFFLPYFGKEINIPPVLHLIPQGCWRGPSLYYVQTFFIFMNSDRNKVFVTEKKDGLEQQRSQDGFKPCEQYDISLKPPRPPRCKYFFSR